MRVLLVTESFLPYVSGVTVSVDALARGLGARGHDVLVLAPRPASDEAPPDMGSPGPAPRFAWLPSYQLPVVVPPLYRMPLPHPGAGALRDARRFRPDVVHAHTPFVSGQLARSVARARGAPLVFTHHTRFGDYGHYVGALAGIASRMVDAYLRRWWTACDAVIAPSTDLADEIRARLPPGAATTVRVIPTGVDVAALRAVDAPDLRAAHGWPPGSVIVGSLGRLAPEKSPEHVLEAVARAASTTDVRLLLIGGGPSAGALAARASRPDLAGRVAFTGLLPRPDALRTLRGADLFAFASRTETQGLVLAEALAAGLPAVAVDGPGVRDSVRDGIDGLVVPAGPDEDVVGRLAAAIVALAADPGRRAAMAARAAADAERFAIERRIDDTEELYRELSGRGRRESLAPP